MLLFDELQMYTDHYMNLHTGKKQFQTFLLYHTSLLYLEKYKFPCYNIFTM